jgi:dolichol-phosphate mannosyltransferase
MKDELHSIVVPVFNSREILPLLVDRVSRAMNEVGFDYELILVDDGSQDGSFEEIGSLAALNPQIRGFRLSRNFGHQAALVMGLQNTRGDYTAIIDDDCQDPPELLPTFFSHLHEGFDVVYGVRRQRKESMLKKMVFAVYYRTLRLMSSIDVPLDAGDFCAMRQSVVQAILNSKEANPFLRGIRAWVGFKQIGVEYNRDARQYGKPGYTLKSYFKMAIAGILAFSTMPLRLIIYMGLLATTVGLVYSLVAIGYWATTPDMVPGYTSIICLITFMGGVQLISIGILGGYLSRIYDNTKRRPLAIVAEMTASDSE